MFRGADGGAVFMIVAGDVVWIMGEDMVLFGEGSDVE